MTAIVREAEAKDIESVLALYRQLRPNDPALTIVAATDAFDSFNLISSGAAIFVCEADGALVATCELAIVPTLTNGARPFGVIEHVVTSSACRRKGYARLLLDHALAAAWSRGCYKVVLLSGAQRPEAHRLYESVGFNGDIERGFVAKPGSAA